MAIWLNAAALLADPQAGLPKGNLVVIGCHKASREELTKGEPAAARNLKVHVLRSGMTFQFDESRQAQRNANLH